MKPEDIQKFSSDFRILAEILNEIPSQEPVIHEEELLGVLYFLKKDTRYLELKEEMKNRKDGDHMSCSVLDAAIEKGRLLGLEEGRLSGLEEGRLFGLEEGRLSGLEEGRCFGLEEGHRSGLIEGHRSGLEEGWKIFILDHIEESIPRERTIEKLQTKWGLKKEEAEKEYDRIANEEPTSNALFVSK